MGGLLLIQLLVADVVGLSSGHTPGSTVVSNHDNFHFRTVRAHANTNESVAALLLLVVACIALGASPQWVNWLSIAYCLGRVSHMLCYWFNWSIPRSLSFVVSLAALFGLFALGTAAAI